MKNKKTLKAELKKTEQNLKTKERALKYLAKCSKALLAAANEQDLLNRICRIIIDVGGYQQAWIGYAENDKKKTVRPVAQAGHEDGYLDTVNITWADTKQGQNPTGKAIRMGKPSIMKNIDSNTSHASSIALPLRDKGKTFGALTIYSSELNAFDTEEVYLLKELVNDLAYGIASFRIRTLQKTSEKELKQTLKKLRGALGGTIQVIESIVKIRDPFTAGHQRRVADLARSIAKEMGLSVNQIDALRMAGQVHDIGKISVPSEILSKPKRLTETEFELIKSHSREGYDILKNINFPWPVAEIVLQHHERLDGSGYPDGLKNGQILIEAKVLGVADVVEAMSSHRPYRASLGKNKALEEIKKNKGILYEPEAVDVCVKLFTNKGYEFK
ncbi:MAG: HD domain-containing protein [Candidatus Aminicenantes bacterium]|nr:HD domain-containing protein [Candidatus Aminicenantes bacterium]